MAILGETPVAMTHPSGPRAAKLLQSSVDPNYANYYVDGDPKLPKVTRIYNNHPNLDYVCNLSIETHGDLGSPMTYETPKLKFPQRFEHPNASLRARPTFSTVCTALASRSPVNK